MISSVLYEQFDSFSHELVVQLLHELERGGTAGDIEDRLQRHGVFLAKSSDLLNEVRALIRHRVETSRLIKLGREDYVEVAAFMRAVSGPIRCPSDVASLLRAEADDVERLYTAGGIKGATMQVVQLDGISRLRCAGQSLTKSGYTFDALQLFLRFLRKGRQYLPREEWAGRTFISPPLLGDPRDGSLSEVPEDLQGRYLVARVNENIPEITHLSLMDEDYEVDPSTTYYYVHARKRAR